MPLHHRIVLSLAIILGAASLAPAQRVLGADPNKQGVFVRDSADAAAKLASAQRMERLKEWDKSADVYQEILDKYSDRVIASATDAQGRVLRYASVSSAVQDALCLWPAEGREVYRARFEPAAQALLEGAGDESARLYAVAARYFITCVSSSATISATSSDLVLKRRIVLPTVFSSRSPSL